jgi:asparagine N-glycosylation enzyme membrane subunit Stt3
VRRPSTSPEASTAGIDLALVALFVALGRTSHREGGAIGGYAVAAWPFLTGALLGWVAILAARRTGRELPGRSIPAGGVVLAGTVVGGMVLRRVFTDGGTPVSFLVVATSFLSFFLLGWRGLDRARRARAARA